MSRKLLLLLSDTHGGSDVGLCNPETKLWEKMRRRSHKSPSLTSTQKLLWEAFEKHLDRAKEIAGGDKVVVVHLGDVTHGGVFLTDVSEPRLMGQYQIAKYNMYRIIEEFPNIEALFMIEGTNVHLFDGSVEYILADHLREKFDFDVSCYPHTLLRIGETTHDLAHHGPSPGIRVWTSPNTALYWLRDMMFRELMAGRVPTTVTYRGHFHQWVPAITHRQPVERDDHSVEQFVSHFQFVPSYTGLNDYARKVTKSQGSIVWGMILVEIIDGKTVVFHPLVNSYDTRVREEIQL